MKKVGLVSSIYETTSGYSVTTVIENTLRMLVSNGYEPVILVDREFKSDNPFWSPTNIDVRPIMHRAMNPEEVADVISVNLGDCTTVLTHDVYMFDYFKPWQHGIALDFDRRPKVTWLHWLHSVPTVPTPPPPGYIVYPNHSDAGRVLRCFNLYAKDEKLITNFSAHSVDPIAAIGADESTRFIAEAAGMLESDVVAVYPARMNASKGHIKIVDLLAGVAAYGYRVCLVCCDWQSASPEFQGVIDSVYKKAEDLGIADRVFFTSRMRDDWKNGVPRRTAMQLMSLSNLYVHPSSIETYSLVTHEAILHGLQVVCNYDMPVAHEVFGDMVMYMDFGSDGMIREYHPDSATFWKDEAGRLLAAMRSNKPLWSRTQIRKTRNPRSSWKEFEWMLHLPPLR